LPSLNVARILTVLRWQELQAQTAKHQAMMEITRQIMKNSISLTMTDAGEL